MQKFKPNAREKEVVEDLARKFKNGEIESFSEFISTLLDMFMLSERNIVLKEFEGDKGNGFYPRRLTSGGETYELNVPRARKGSFRPSILPAPWKRTTVDYREFVISLLGNGYSPNKIKRTLQRLNAPYSEEEIGEITEDFSKELEEFKSRALDEGYLAVFIDAYEAKMRRESGLRKVQIYVGIGINLNGEKELLGWWIGEGRENKGFWQEVLRKLIERGLKKPLVIVSDDFPGLDEVIKDLFPLTDHQLCYVHFKRNVMRNMARKDAQEFLIGAKRVQNAFNFDEGIKEFTELCGKFEDKYPGYIKYIKGKAEHYLVFLRYPKKVAKHIYTTNLIESFNRLMEDIRYEKRGIFQSEKVLGVNIWLTYKRLKEGKWAKPMPQIASCKYEIHQLFNLRFRKED